MNDLLNEINGPADLKNLSQDKLKKLSREIRDFLIKNLSETGGHLASNLGVVELTVALHYHLNSPRDKIVWDVGHQSYTHKILTGRKNKFSTLRKYNGLSGYLKRKESIHDIIEAGHTSTSISSALGLALARDLENKKDRIYGIIGDGALTGGMAFEALNHAGHLKTNLNIILNDNEMSISANTGALSQYLSSIRTDPAVSRVREDIEFLLNRIPRIGKTVSKTVDRVKNALKYTIIAGVLFEEMGFTYLGPIDGHNIETLIDNFQKADRIDGPVLIHVNTCKGKGYKPAEDNPSKYHGVGPFDIKSGNGTPQKSDLTYSQVFGQTMIKMGKSNQKLTGITAAMPKGTCLDLFAEQFPDRFFDVGIAEQHAVTLAAGLARGGQKPVVAVYSTFLQRAFDQIIQDVCMQKLPVTFAIDRAGIVGKDGETHQGVFDISYLRMMPNITIMAPKDKNELQHMLYTAVNHEGPISVRYPRGRGYQTELDKDLKEIPIGKAELLKEGKDVLMIAVGSRVMPVFEAAEILAKRGISTGVINARFIKPLDQKLLLTEIKKYKYIITVEEQVLTGGFGSAVLELINEHNLNIDYFERLGLPDEFIPHGSTEKIRKIYGIDTEGIVKKVQQLLKNPEAIIWPKKNA